MEKITITTGEELTEAINKYIESLPMYTQQVDFACDSIFEIVTWAGKDFYSIMGILEFVRFRCYTELMIVEKENKK